MNILQIIYESEQSPFGIGGAGVRAYSIYERLVARHDVTMLCMRYPGAVDGRFRGIRHVFAGTESKNLHKSVAAYALAASRFVARRGAEFDVIVENYLPTTPFFSRIRTRTPVIMQVQGVLEGHAYRKFPLWLSVPMALMDRFYLPRHDHFIFVSEVTRQKVLGHRPPPAGISPVIENGVDLEQFPSAAPGGESDTLLFFSRLDEYTKGLDLLMDAFAGLADSFPRMRLVLAGTDFTPFAVLLERVPARFRDRVRYAGFVREGEKAQLLASARMVVLPSRHESAPVSLLEAAAAGRPLLVSDIPELEFVQREGLGRSFETGNASALQEAIRDLWDDRPLLEVMGARGMKYVENFQWRVLAERFEKALAQVAASARPV